jgi:hypothetical protein
MKMLQKRYSIVLSVLCILFSLSLSAKPFQPKDEVVYKNWDKLGESSNHVDVFARVIKCTSTNQVHLMVFNESSVDQVSKFVIEVTNPASQQKFSKEVSFSTVKAAIYKAECNSDVSTNALKIDLPEGYDPTQVKITIEFKS